MKRITPIEYTGLAMIVMFVLLLVVWTPYYNYGTDEITTFTVTGKERIVESKGQSTTSKYLVFTENETFENTDSLLHFKFDSSEVYGQLEEGETYSAKVYGFRVPFLSMYRNIVFVEEVQ